MTALTTFPAKSRVAVVGASGGVGQALAIEQWQEPRCESGDVVNAARILVRKHMKLIAADTLYHPCNDI